MLYELDNHHDWEQILELCDELIIPDQLHNRTADIKRRAAEYLDAPKKHLTRTELRALFAKTNKIKTHIKKEQRNRNERLSREIVWVYNFK